MKTLVRIKSFIFILFMAMPPIAQEDGLSKTYVQQGDQIKHTEFYKNGQIAQTGFSQREESWTWTSFNQDGTKKSEGIFKMEKS